jgi:large conductance mechanosensitive channel
MKNMKSIKSIKSMKSMKSMKSIRNILSEFRNFAMHGNAIDLAIGVIIGAGFKTIVDSIVTDIFKPIISLITQILSQREKFHFNVDFAWATVNTSINNFLTAVVNFLIVAACIFFIVQVMNKVHKKEAKPIEPAPTRSEVLLAEIRDLLIQTKTNSDMPEKFEKHLDDKQEHLDD